MVMHNLCELGVQLIRFKCKYNVKIRCLHALRDSNMHKADTESNFLHSACNYSLLILLFNQFAKIHNSSLNTSHFA